VNFHFHLRSVNRSFVAALAVLLCCTAPALATVSLTISDNDATPNSAVVGAGNTFSFTVRLVSTSEQTAGIDYYLTTPDGSNRFSIVDRNTAGGMYNDPLYFTDTTVEASPSNLLNPRNDNDLGGLATSTLNAGTYLVANYTLLVDAATPNGIYTINTTVANANEGWIDPSSGEHPFTSHGAFTVSVPEPSGLGLAMLVVAGLIRRRRLIP
jgi:MYXO-CTERM domain-containing protein